MSFPNGRHFFIEDGVLKLTVAKTPLQGTGEAVLEHPVRFSPFCETPGVRTVGMTAVGTFRTITRCPT